MRFILANRISTFLRSRRGCSVATKVDMTPIVSSSTKSLLLKLPKAANSTSLSRRTPIARRTSGNRDNTSNRVDVLGGAVRLPPIPILALLASAMEYFGRLAAHSDALPNRATACPAAFP